MEAFFLSGNSFSTSATKSSSTAGSTNTFAFTELSYRYPFARTSGTHRTFSRPLTTTTSLCPPIVPGGGFGIDPKNAASASSRTSRKSHPQSQSTRASSASATNASPASNASRVTASNTGSPYCGIARGVVARRCRPRADRDGLEGARTRASAREGARTRARDAGMRARSRAATARRARASAVGARGARRTTKSSSSAPTREERRRRWIEFKTVSRAMRWRARHRERVRGKVIAE